MSEGVEVVISADDQATDKINDVADNIDAKVKRIKEVGGRAKASTEFIGTLASSLGSSELASFAGGLGQLTERISAFSEVSKAGGGGALAFKAGLLGVAAVAGYKIGTMIGDWAFETERWTEQLSKATEELKIAGDALNRVESIKLSFRVEKAELGGEVEQRKLLNELTEKAFAIEEEIERTKAAQLKDNEGIVGYERFLAGNSEIIAEANKAELDVSQQKLDLINREKEALIAKLSPQKAELEAMKEKAALQEKNKSYIEGLKNEVALLNASSKAHEARNQAASIDREIAGLAQRKAGGENVDAEIEALTRKKAIVEATAESERRAIEAQQRAGGDVEAAKKIESLLHQKDLIEATKEAEKQASEQVKKAAEEQIKAAEQVADLKKKESDRIREQILLVTQGKEAAKAFALEQQGIDKESAKRLAAQQAMADELGKKLEGNDPQQAVQGRLLTRGRTDDIRQKQLDTALKQYDVLKRIEENSKAFKSQTEVAFEVVGRG